jgi:class 3 adenylate cyclase
MKSHALGSGPAVPEARDSAPDVRKTVTILFVDIVDSSRLSLALDPEALRNLLARYFDELSAVIQRHGGVVETYIGDAIMAVFGTPIAHEDDGPRAVRAAVEMRDTLAILNREFEAGWGVRLANRVGINTGEVIASAQGHLSVAGEAINVAKRLEEAAAANEILIGEPTYGLVRDMVVVKPSGPRPLKHGKIIHALVVVDVVARAPGSVRRFDSPFVGRARQRAVIETALGNVIRDKACHLLTVLGGAGVGKSRLVWEVAGGFAGDVTVLRGRCLPYGEGITYWPLAEIVRQIARTEGRDPGVQSASALLARLAG